MCGRIDRRASCACRRCDERLEGERRGCRLWRAYDRERRGGATHAITIAIALSLADPEHSSSLFMPRAFCPASSSRAQRHGVAAGRMPSCASSGGPCRTRSRVMPKPGKAVDPSLCLPPGVRRPVGLHRNQRWMYVPKNPRTARPGSRPRAHETLRQTDGAACHTDAGVRPGLRDRLLVQGDAD